MDTNDPRFQSAYNDLVGAFFRFINVVNPAPTPEVQVQLILNALQSLIGTMEENPLFHGNSGTVGAYTQDPQPGEMPTTQPEPQSQPQPRQPEPQPEPRQPEPKPEPDSHTHPAVGCYPEKRFATLPTFTSDEVYRFIIKNLRKEEAFKDGGIDKRDYPLILEFNGTEGIFSLNIETIEQTYLPIFTKEVAVVIGNLTKDNVWVEKPGRIKKTTGAWEIVAPMHLAANND